MKITVYSSDTCPHCVSLKKWLKNNQIDYIEKNVKKAKFAEELQNKGIKVIPYMTIEDENTKEVDSFVGFNPKILAERLL
ncbi:glutaredoxin family protein [Heyndrickxia oleronia]|uniref:Glutaredoxin domain-containing protein n=1 Tax=Heyndrickxia oleronia TaxID=38875 RepID=A0A8E2LD60_9BACI|nr:glutaredoxin family protein [Heyndrickxia oleronia]MEC1373801.1 glutaredoxin family protein [Heyndrickxia oleronia]OOP66277.1 hypothetical protein BWZ43_21820 [Heyndrickxia oleronia]QQZ05385.1 glutaredoxin family protein [Heyndrickxia oleronia]